jgi:N-alpha-acetyl-L-2,4-diaminobutyrate deacetylase
MKSSDGIFTNGKVALFGSQARTALRQARRCMNDGRVWTDIDLDACGKQHGQIFVPVSTDESAYGAVATSVTVISHRQGPSMLLVGGVHGDEYEGPILLSKLVHRLKLEMVNGRLIIVPALNIAALEEGRRNSPLDQLNLNRVFP